VGGGGAVGCDGTAIVVGPSSYSTEGRESGSPKRHRFRIVQDSLGPLPTHTLFSFYGQTRQNVNQSTPWNCVGAVEGKP
jgi:hypothetical protein